MNLLALKARCYIIQAICTAKEFTSPKSRGVILEHTIDKMPCSYVLSARQSEQVAVSTCPYFDPNSDGIEPWIQLKNYGQFEEVAAAAARKVAGGEMACGVAAKTILSPSASQNIEMSLVWDMPTVHFPGNTSRKYDRFYTTVFPNQYSPQDIADYTFERYSYWDEAIYKWQNPVLNDR